eukprot:Protomagalhaensia_sp_Gyna_25__5237@NODE_637_length_2941_cov_339_742247_g496_i0_p3_GENE_NODE_637_length_2941_cov_339_742247_g496_i0NODE_637_length_2941_cov_339_742247_g496_i0_p3_ORF_typecomplete_len155_score40_66Nop25/PF09805_9/2_3e14CEP19/PF14933_6/0_072SURF2/PF05477_11/0_54CDC37_N/PF03234_14/1_5DUF1168/PF06658_12/2Ant_C/PF05586_11/1_5Ant_C/PF05586_11/4_5e03TPK_catalytic/PF04263_16/1_6TPK_catalytic/PF04263_16/3_3e02SMC_N/PF02463_19/5_9_NODE_637_length_2941_cov_339_742247_g496_i019252389
MPPRLEVKYDAVDRHNYLTGFRARRLEKKRQAKIRVKEQQRQERIDTEKATRQALKFQYKQIQYAKRKAEKWKLPQQDKLDMIAKLKEEDEQEEENPTTVKSEIEDTDASDDEELNGAKNPFLVKGKKELSGAFYGNSGIKVIVHTGESLESIL